jgi:hypothetical protein
MEDKMQKIRYGLIVLLMLLSPMTSSAAQISIGIGLPNVSIGINLPLFPELVAVPGYPVYYAPRLDANYFFYDGMYWVYQDDDWYASSWYNGPWGFVEPEVVPLFILRVPVRYYRQPPEYFRGWRSNAPPRWGQHWGHEWEQRRGGWDRWNRGSAPGRAPLPVYQRQYSGDRYPRAVEQQQKLRSQQYRYQPRDKVIQKHFRQQEGERAPAPAQRGRHEEPPMRSPRQQGDENLQRSAPDQTPPRQRGPAYQDQRRQPESEQREQQSPRLQGREQRYQDRGESQEPKRGHGQEQNKGEERGRDRNN